MPVVDCKVTDAFGGTSVNWTRFSNGLFDLSNIVAALQAEGSGDWIYNFAGFTCVAQMLCDCSAIPVGSTINSVTLVANCEGDFITQDPEIDLGILSDAGNYDLFPAAVAGAFAEITALYPNPITLTELADSLLKIGTVHNANVRCDYLAFRVDYTPPTITEIDFDASEFEITKPTFEVLQGLALESVNIDIDPEGLGNKIKYGPFANPPEVVGPPTLPFTAAAIHFAGAFGFLELYPVGLGTSPIIYAKRRRRPFPPI